MNFLQWVREHMLKHESIEVPTPTSEEEKRRVREQQQEQEQRLRFLQGQIDVIRRRT